MSEPLILGDHEYELIRLISRGVARSQRVMSARLGLSLGMTNLILRNLAQKGIITVRRLDRKKAEYLLTPRGAAEYSRKAYSCTLSTIASFRHLKDGIKRLILQRHQQGHRKIGF